MIYDHDFREAARRAEKGVNRAIASLHRGLVKREDDLSGVLKGNLDAELEGTIGDLTWQCTILDHSSGQSAEEKEFGADIWLGGPLRRLICGLGPDPGDPELGDTKSS